MADDRKKNQGGQKAPAPVRVIKVVSTPEAVKVNNRADNSGSNIDGDALRGDPRFQH
jgi:hypothetical protein